LATVSGQTGRQLNLAE